MKTLIIAEIGENHYGQWDVCRGLVQEACKNGAAVVKFQTFSADQLVGKDHPDYEWFKRVAMPKSVHYEMRDLCKKLGVRFMCSPFTIKAAQFIVEELGCAEIKLASSVLFKHSVLDSINRRADQVKVAYLSTGCATVDEITAGLAHLDKIEKVYLLHCVSQYPTPDRDVNLRALLTLKKRFPEHPIGYSDHSVGIEACVAAVALGAQVLEKHITYHTAMPGTDHAGGMTPGDLARLVERVDRLENMLGHGEKIPSEGEKPFMQNACKKQFNEADLVA